MTMRVVIAENSAAAFFIMDIAFRSGWIMEALEKSDAKPAEKTEPQEERKIKTWRGSPRVWERCALCEAKKKCSKAGVKRGSRQCVDARYTIARK